MTAPAVPRRRSPELSFPTKLAFGLTLASIALLCGLRLVYSPTDAALAADSAFSINGRRLDQQQDDGNGDDGTNNYPTDYAQYSCDKLYETTPDAGDAQCLFARTCNDYDGVWAPFVFCSNRHTTTLLSSLIAPIIILWMVLLFRILGSTAEDYFSPALEMFSVKLGLPPRFAGVTLLALGNGAADVSATISAITSDPQNGYMMSLGALSGAAMMIGCVVCSLVVLTAQGVPCRGALVRDVMAMLVTVLVVWLQLRTGRVGPETISLFLSMYIIFVFLVLVADIYHRRVVLPRQRLLADQGESVRQAEEGGMQQRDTTEKAQGFPNVLSALSNYDSSTAQENGWSVDADALGRDQPVMLHGTHGILAGTHTSTMRHANGAQATDGYSMLEDAIDRACVGPGGARKAGSWSDAFAGCKEDLRQHAETVWEDIVWNGEVNVVDKFLLLCELPITTLRKMTVPIPCEGFYVRGVVAISLAISPWWLALYLYRSHGVNVFSGQAWIYFTSTMLVILVVAACILRFAPTGQDQMPLYVSGPIALYGFAIAATWIDTIADSLVSLLSFIGIILDIPSAVLGLTLLAWGNSMSDLSANVTMARKGLANMAITACFAGPVFNILVGLGLGFSTLATQTGQTEREVALQSSVLTGFAFIIANCCLILAAGLVFGKGRIIKEYGYASLTLYAAYLITSIYREYAGSKQ
ncbi:hypothetical protein MPSEU_000450100 [Mayamaea pseudoterrestris]|nr:hypothetical protein MPSEU_000450100 [Mayamaea pseudoterrestris]